MSRVAAVSSDKGWHARSVEEAASQLRVDPSRGLSRVEAERRLAEHGPNTVGEAKRRGVLRALAEQFESILVIILLVAAGISVWMGETTDAASIIAIILFMAVMGVVQEYRAEHALEALKRLAAPRAKILRDGAVSEVAAEEIVPGDILVLEEGDRVAADARLISSTDLYVDESMLTGESTPVHKDHRPVLGPDTPLADRVNMVYMGTYVVRGRGLGLVVGTGMDTVVGRIAGMLKEAEEEKTPLQKDLDVFGRKLGIIILVIAATLFVTGLLLHEASVMEMFMASVALAVAAVPEGLPAIVTVVLAVAVWRMARRNAIVRRLAAVETLGAATVICTDKTGTLTKNEMSVREIWLPPDRRIKALGAGYTAEGSLLENGEKITVEGDGDLGLLLLAAVLNNNAEVNGGSVLGDPLEAALLFAAAKGGVDFKEARMKYRRLREIPFTSERKMMSTINMVEGRKIMFSKGAPEVIVEKSRYIRINGETLPLTDELRRRILSSAEDMASRALRVLGFAYKPASNLEDDEDNLVFLGLMGLIDPPRPEVPSAVREALNAGVKVVMVTGDHRLTATAIAREIGLPVEGEHSVVTGRELERMSDEELESIIDDVTVFARVAPEHKARIVRAYKARGHVVAMTGDGVNDAPALKLADIGVAMGRRGTDVAKEAADMILADDNFATIVAAIEEGRTAYDNIRKAVLYLLSANFAEVASVFIAGMAGWGLLFTPAMLLWINLVTDALPAAAMATEPSEPDIMNRPPRKRGSGMLDKHAMTYLSYIGLTLTLIVLGVYVYSRFAWSHTHLYAATLAFLVMMASELFHSFNTRSFNHSLLRIGLLSNKKHIASVLIGFAMALAAVYLVPQAFDAVRPGVTHAAIAILASALIIPVDEARKRLGFKL